jgi:hypothetical protein
MNIASNFFMSIPLLLKPPGGVGLAKKCGSRYGLSESTTHAESPKKTPKKTIMRDGVYIDINQLASLVCAVAGRID